MANPTEAPIGDRIGLALMSVFIFSTWLWFAAYMIRPIRVRQGKVLIPRHLCRTRTVPREEVRRVWTESADVEGAVVDRPFLRTVDNEDVRLFAATADSDREALEKAAEFAVAVGVDPPATSGEPDF